MSRHIIEIDRLKIASKVAALHVCLSAVVAALAAGVVFFLWYPYPYGELAGGRGLFTLIVSVDVVCGPLLTFVLYSPKKPKIEIIRDLSLVALIQFCALVYGVVTVWNARPLYLVAEVDRFKVISAVALPDNFKQILPSTMVPNLFQGPMTIGVRAPKDIEEKNTVMFESLEGGADYAERPNFFVAYDRAVAEKLMKRSKPLADFLTRYPEQRVAADQLARLQGKATETLHYLPVIGRQDWIAVMDLQGNIAGFLKGDGF